MSFPTSSATRALVRVDSDSSRSLCVSGWAARLCSSLGSVWVLVLALGLFPEPLMAFGKLAAAALLDPSAYIAATGLAEVTP